MKIVYCIRYAESAFPTKQLIGGSWSVMSFDMGYK